MGAGDESHECDYSRLDLIDQIELRTDRFLQIQTLIYRAYTQEILINGERRVSVLRE